MLEHESLQELARGLVTPSYVRQGADEILAQNKLAKSLLSCRAMPEHPWPEAAVERLLSVWLPDLCSGSCRYVKRTNCRVNKQNLI